MLLDGFMKRFAYWSTETYNLFGVPLRDPSGDYYLYGRTDNFSLAASDLPPSDELIIFL